MEFHLGWAFKEAKEHTEREMARHEHYHDHKMQCMSLEVGDQVLVCIKAFGTDHKITDKCENDPYIVGECMVGKPAYKIKPLQDTENTNSHVVYRNMLYPLRTNFSSEVIHGVL